MWGLAPGRAGGPRVWGWMWVEEWVAGEDVDDGKYRCPRLEWQRDTSTEMWTLELVGRSRERRELANG